MIRVLHVFGRMDRHGAETRTVELMPIFAKRGVHFDFCTLVRGEGQLDGRIRQLGGEVFPCPLRHGVLSFGRRFVRVLKRCNCDIVHSHTHYFSGNIVRLAHKAGIKGRIVHFRSTGDGKPVTFRRKLYHKIMRKFADRHATSILAVCRSVMEYSWGQDWLSDQRCWVIYNGLDLGVFEQEPLDRKGVRAELGILEGSVLVINIGRFNRAKGHDVLLDTAKEIVAQDSMIHFVLAGDGELRDAMVAKARGYGIAQNVHFLGSRSDVARLLKAADCFVLSSRREGLPGAVLEAVAANLPVIATNLPGVREIAEHTDLISTVAVEDSNALAAGILKTIKNIEAQPAGKQIFPREFDLHNCAEKLFEVYSQQVE